VPILTIHASISDLPFSSEIKDIVSSTDQGFSYFDPDSTSASLQAVEDLEQFIAREGPYDGVLAFSQGMMLACTLLMRNVEQKTPFPFKCAIFFSPRMAPLDCADLSRGVFTEIDAKRFSQAIGIPTTLVWGSMDPHATKAVELQELFRQNGLFTCVHEGGHEVPGYALKKGLMDTVNVIRRTTNQAALISP
jgi:predicted esterase